MDRRLSDIYHNMKKRCYNPRSTFYKFYGGRGIKVCDEWMTGFKAFAKWAYSHGYKANLTIDRIDNDKGYCPENCRWVTMRQQVLNRSISKHYTLDGVTKPLIDWCNECGVSYNVVRWRIKKWGWSKRVLEKQTRTSNPHGVVAICGERVERYASVKSASRANGCSDTAIHKAIRRGGTCNGKTWKFEEN